MALIKKNDFVELEYTGRLKEEKFVFDTTDAKIAKENGLDTENTAYGPAIVCIGEGQLLKGLEEDLEGKEIGKEYHIDLSPEKAFGKKDAKLIRMIPFNAFKKQNIMPQPGLQVNIDGLIGMVKTVSGGRCLVDFNHPLSGKEVTYQIKANRIVTDNKEKISSILRLSFNLQADVEEKEGSFIIKTKSDMPKEAKDFIEKKIKELVPSVGKIEFSVEAKK